MSKQDILNSDQVFLDFAFTTQIQAFKEIAYHAKKLGFLKKDASEQTLVNSFLQREKEGTTGFGDGVAVPHARNQDIIKSGIFIMRFKDPVEWKAMDKQPVKAIIALIVPIKTASNEHLEILSKVAQKLAKAEFQTILLQSKDKSTIIKALDIIGDNNNEQLKQTANLLGNNNKKNIVAITACPVGVAHTYIAQDKLEFAAKTLGHNIKVETHGSIGIKGTLTATDIEKADLVIIAVAAGAADLGLERFAGKPLYQLEIAKVIKDPISTMNEAFKNAKPFEKKGGGNKTLGSASADIFSTDKKGIMKHIMAGVGYMVPFVVFGGIMIALAAGIGQAIYGPGKSAPYGTFLWFMNQVGGIGFQLMIPILAGFIANSIAGRAALAPAIISAFIANTTVANGIGKDPHTGDPIVNMVTLVFPINGLGTSTPAGFLGALLIGPFVGYLVKWIITWKVPKSLAPVMPIFFIPIVVTFVVSFTFIYAIGAPIGWIMSKFAEGLKGLAKYQAAMGAIGLLLGAMVGFDMGGPVNKVAFLVASTTINLDPTKAGGGPETALFMGAVAAGIPVAPLGMGLTTLIFRKNFNENERNLGITAMILGFIGISEGAIPFAIRDPKRAIIANIIGSAIAGAIAGALLLTDGAAHGGPIVAILGAVGALNYAKGVGIALFFLAIIIGAAVTCLIYGALLIIQSRNIIVFKVITTKIAMLFTKKQKKQLKIINK